jgi:hypothetical protein
MAETNLNDLLFAGVDRNRFKPYVEFSPQADAINVYFKPDPDYSERLNENVTLFRSLSDKSLVGCRIKGISGILEDAQNWLKIDHDGIQLKLIFWSFRGSADNDQVRETLEELVEGAGDLKLEPCNS